ncbi:nuclear transport factor 2 family protein [Streptomyces sp. NPDC046215]|uniref:SnoaL-like domain-containing protein n=1 Tax=Streptomyces stramineus TaxID=173861 RepID=A0ABN0ZW80_9ACTN
MTDNTAVTQHEGGVEEHLAHYTRVFNSGDADAINRLYSDDAVSEWELGKPLTGQARKDALAEFLTLKPRLTTKIRQSHVTATTAFLVVDWTMETTNPDGTKELVKGIGTDVMHRGEEGEWRYVIDVPLGDPRNAEEPAPISE